MSYIDIHTHTTNSVEEQIAIRNVFPDQAFYGGNTQQPYFSVGLHPWYINPDSMLAELEIVKILAAHPFCLAIGETGLDKLTQTSFELQKEVFVKHLEIACGFSKPVIIHCVRAFPEILQLYEPFAGKVKLIFHGFNNSSQIVKQLMNHGCYLSFGKALLNPESNACKLFPEIPDNRFFLETDEADISIDDVYRKAAKLKNLTLEKLQIIIIENFENCFGNVV